VIVASTPKGGRNRKFYQIINDATGLWSRHVVDIYEAVKQGLPLNIEEERKAMGDPDGWAQEFELQWLDEVSAWLPFDLIASCEDEAAGDPGAYNRSNLVYIGNDIARRRDLWVAWVLEKVGDVLWTREVVELHNAKFAEHDAEMRRLFQTYRVGRLCMDQTGMGEKPVEDYQRWFGSTRVEGLLFNSTNKQGLATLAKQSFEARKLRVPDRAEIRDDLYKLKKTTSASGSPRFDADRDESGHADRAWALFLALNAADTGGTTAIEYETVKPRPTWDEGLGLSRASTRGY
jgi:phage FluMu gp28-like protein